MSVTTAHRRLQCLQLANTLATAKVIKPTEVLTTARSYFGFIDGDEKMHAALDDLEKLRDRFDQRRG